MSPWRHAGRALILSAACLLLLCLVLLAGPRPDAAAEVVVDDATVWSNATLSLTENVTVVAGGSLTVVNSTLTFQCSTPLELGIEVRAGGSLTVRDLDGSPATPGDASVLAGDVPYFVVARAGSTLRISNSVVRNCGDSSTVPLPLYVPGGMVLGTGSFTVEGSTFEGAHNGLFADHTVGGVVRGCTFRDLAYGIKADMAEDLTVEGCAFSSLGTGIYLRTAAPGIPYTPIDGTVVVEGCSFRRVSGEAVHVDYPRNVDLSNCSFVGPSRAGVYLVGVNPDVSVALDSRSRLADCSFEGLEWPLVLDDIVNMTVVGSTFSNFTIGVSLNKVTARDVRVTGCLLARGWYGVDLNVRVASDVSVAGCTFRHLATGIDPAGDGFRVEDCTFEDQAVAGIVHESSGLLTVEGCRFLDSVTGIKVQHEFVPRPGLVLDGCEFSGNAVGLLARDAAPLSVGSNTWSRNGVAVMVLGMDATVGAQEAISDCDVAFRLVSSTVVLDNVTVASGGVAVWADLGARVDVVASDTAGCDLDGHAANGSSVRVIDSRHGSAFTVLDADSSVQVLWTVTVHVAFLTTGSPAPGTDVLLAPARGAGPGTLTTDASGDVGPLLVLQARWGPPGMEDMLPYTATVYHRGLGHPTPVRFEVEHWFLLEIDDMPPLIAVPGLPDPPLVNATPLQLAVTVEDEGSGVVSLVVLLDGQEERSLEDPGSPVDLSLDLVDGTHRLVLNATDAWMNSAELPLDLDVDTLPPGVWLGTPVNGTLTNGTALWFNGTTTGADRGAVGGLDMPLADDGSFAVEVPLEEGPNLVTVTVWDTHGNAAGTTLHVTRDTTPPSIELEEVPSLVRSPSLAVAGTTDGVRLRVSPGGVDATVEGGFEVRLDLVEGPNTFLLEVWDAAGNRATAEASVTLDGRLEFSLDTPASGSTVHEAAVIVQGRAEEGLRFRLEGVDDGWTVVGAGGAFNVTLELGSFGPNDFVFQLEDPAGNDGTYRYGLNRAGVHPGPGDGFPTVLVAVLAVVAVVVAALLLATWSRRGER